MHQFTLVIMSNPRFFPLISCHNSTALHDGKPVSHEQVQCQQKAGRSPLQIRIKTQIELRLCSILSDLGRIKTIAVLRRQFLTPRYETPVTVGFNELK